jgi:hypothetical protein
MTQWEYLTLFLEAKAHKEDEEKLKKRFNKKKLPQQTPERLIPELDQLGAAGWELVHMEPVPKVGGKGDILFGGVARWSSTYFCVFKRPKGEASPPAAWTVAQPNIALPPIEPPDQPATPAEPPELPESPAPAAEPPPATASKPAAPAQDEDPAKAYLREALVRPPRKRPSTQATRE